MQIGMIGLGRMGANMARRLLEAGLFDQAPGSVITPLLLSIPNWLQFHVTVNGAPLSLEAGEILDQRRTLDLQRARLLHDLRWRSSSGDIVRLQTVRFASLAQRALAIQLARLTVEQPSHVSLETYLEAAQPPLQQLQLDGGMGIWRTAQTHTVLAMAHDQTLSLGDQVLRATVHRQGLRWEWQAAPAQPATLIRFITVARSKDEAQSRSAVAATRQHALTQGTHALYIAHTRAWQERWDASDVLIAGDEQAQQALRFAVYHLIGAANPDDDRVSVGARALTGDGYHGHVFWDTEIFLLPFYTFTWPEAARAMLGYRYQTLPAARLGKVDVAQGYFRDAIAVDLDDTMGNAAQGVHIATLGGLWQAVVFGFAGMRADTDGLHFDPHLPPTWQTLQFRVQWRGKWLQISLRPEPLTFTGLLEQGDALPLTVGDLHHELRAGVAWTCVWDKQAQRWTGAS